MVHSLSLSLTHTLASCVCPRRAYTISLSMRLLECVYASKKCHSQTYIERDVRFKRAYLFGRRTGRATHIKNVCFFLHSASCVSAELSAALAVDEIFANEQICKFLTRYTNKQTTV